MYKNSALRFYRTSMERVEEVVTGGSGHRTHDSEGLISIKQNTKNFSIGISNNFTYNFFQFKFTQLFKIC